ncbi:MAG: chorismate synthase [Crocinitomicaceae bacterium]|nr:chorismate synthase [Crocinitomicaceae bacterium]
MAGNTFGHIFRLTSFGESHGKAIGGIIDGCPSNVEINFKKIQYELNRRKPGQSSITTQRDEADEVEFLSGIFEGKTLGTPIAFQIKNQDQKSEDYDSLKDVFRPSHADFTYQEKYKIRDHRGGGRSSARETAARVVAGAIAKQILAKTGIHICAFVSQIGQVRIEESDLKFSELDIEASLVRCPEKNTSAKMIQLIEEVRSKGDSLGGKIKCTIIGMPAGVGEPVFDKLHADLAKAMMGINAVKGFEIGSGFSAVEMLGSEHNDEFLPGGQTSSNNSGGIQGGISNGQDIYFNVAFKPVATISQKQNTIDKNNNEVVLAAKGRHDPCVVPRAVPIVEAMAALVVLDQLLRQKASQV